MKFKTTKREIMGGYSLVICVSYDRLQHLLKWVDPIAYTTRREGWAADVYQVGSVAIVTGYAPFGNIRPSYDVSKRYDEEALVINCDYSLDYSVQKEKVTALLKSYIEEVTKKEEE